MRPDLAADLELLRASGRLAAALQGDLVPDAAALSDAADAVGHAGLSTRLRELAGAVDLDARALAQRLGDLAHDLPAVAVRLAEADAALAGDRHAAR